jgi:hypothetical protein
MGDQHREVGEVLGDQRGIDRDLLAVEPARVVPGQGSAPARAGEGEGYADERGIGRMPVHDAEAVTGSQAGREGRAKTGVALAAANVTVPDIQAVLLDDKGGLAGSRDPRPSWRSWLDSLLKQTHNQKAQY